MSKQELTKNVIELPTVEKTVEDSLTSGFFTQGQWPDKEWWKWYKDENLDALIQVALINNPSIQSIFKRVEEAKQDAKVVRSKLFPLVFFNYEETWQYLSKNGLYKAFNPKLPIGANLVDLSISFNYEFDFWSKNLNGFRAALGREKSQEAEAAQVELLTSTAVAQAFFALKTNMKKKQLQQKLVESLEAIYRLQNTMKNKALYSLLTPLAGHENVQEAQKILIDIENEIKFDKHLLNILVGRGPDEDLDVGHELSAVPEKLTLPETLSIDLLARRPDLMAQIWKVEALSKDVAIAKADFYPSVNLMAFAGLESTTFGKLLQRSSRTGALEPAIHLPIFTAGAIRANVRSKKAAFDQAVFDYNDLILKSTQEVADLIVLTQSVWEKKYIQNRIVSEAKHLYDLVGLRFREGLDDLFTVLATQISLLEKELEEINLIYNQYLSSIKLTKSLGGGYVSSYLPIKNEEVNSDGR